MESQGNHSPEDDLIPIELDQQQELEEIPAEELASRPEDEPLSLVDDDQQAEVGSKIHAFGSGTRGATGHRASFKRTPNKDGKGAVRCRVFHSKIAENSLERLEEMVNEWLDANPHVEVKHVGHLVGDMVGKKTEPNVIVIVWY